MNLRRIVQAARVDVQELGIKCKGAFETSADFGHRTDEADNDSHGREGRHISRQPESFEEEVTAPYSVVGPQYPSRLVVQPICRGTGQPLK